MSQPAQTIPILVGTTAIANLPRAYTKLLYHALMDVFAQLKNSYPHSPVVVQSTLMPGAPTLIARAALAAGIQLWAVLPLQEERHLRELPSQKARESFLALKRQATRVINTPHYEPEPPPEQHVYPGTEGEPKRVYWELPEEYLHRQAGIYMARHSSFLLTLSDGVMNRDNREPNDFSLLTTMLAREQPFSKMAGDGRPENSGNVLVITAPRLNLPRPPKKLLLQMDLYQGTHKQSMNGLHIYLPELVRIDRYNKDMRRYASREAEALYEQKDWLISTAEQSGLPPITRALLQVTAQAGLLAQRMADRAYTARLTLSILLLALLTAMIVLAPPAPPLLFSAIAIPVCLLSVQGSGRSREGTLSGRYLLLYRTLRSQLYLEIAGIREYAFDVPWWQRSDDQLFVSRAAHAFRRSDWSHSPARPGLLYQSQMHGSINRRRFEAQQNTNRIQMLHKSAGRTLLLPIALLLLAAGLQISAATLPLWAEWLFQLLPLACSVYALSLLIRARPKQEHTLTDSTSYLRSLRKVQPRMRQALLDKNQRQALMLTLFLARQSTALSASSHCYHHKQKVIAPRGKRPIPKDAFDPIKPHSWPAPPAEPPVQIPNKPPF